MRFRSVKSAPKDREILCVLSFKDDGPRELHVMRWDDNPRWPWVYVYDNASECVGPDVVTHWAEVPKLP